MGSSLWSLFLIHCPFDLYWIARIFIMVLIMSERNDVSTNEVVQWFIHWGVSFFRIDQEDVYEVDRIDINKDELFILERGSSRRVNIMAVTAFWFRRGSVELHKFGENLLSSNKSLRENLYRYICFENKVIENFIYHVLESKPSIGSFSNRIVNKLSVLHEAKKIGLNIPHTKVCTCKDDFPVNSNRNITKAIYEGFSAYYNDNYYLTYTEEVYVDEVPDVFFPSLIQNRIEKECDIRVFYLLGSFYSMAIRSQENEQTTTDFRKYLRGIGNRCFPFDLPDHVESKLESLMKKLNLNTGSIDLILGKNGDFTFLEVNPAGQFGMTSHPCNYNIEKKIARALCLMSKS